MSYPDALIAARLAYAVDDFYIANPKLQSHTLESSPDLKELELLKNYMDKWDAATAIQNSAIDTFPSNLEVVVRTLSSGLAIAIVVQTYGFIQDNKEIVEASMSRIHSTMYVLDTQLKGNYGEKVKETIEYRMKGI